jgi:type I restriction-modification system DNA methylase subunit
MSIDDLGDKIWACVDILRGKMDPGDYKNYLLPLLFLKGLSDQGRTKGRFGQISSCEQLGNSFKELESSDTELFRGLFGDVDLGSSKLGRDEQQRNETISSVIAALDGIDFHDYEGDALGDAYEYLLARFAGTAGKSGGEFYTPQAVSDLVSQLVTVGQPSERLAGVGEPFSVLDPTMGSGSLMLNVRKYVEPANGSGKTPQAVAVEMMARVTKVLIGEVKLGAAV